MEVTQVRERVGVSIIVASILLKQTAFYIFIVVGAAIIILGGNAIIREVLSFL